MCGPNSICREVNQHPVCSCQSGYIGMPPNCRAECIVSSDCSQDKACINQKCANPCTPGPCAERAICKVVNHNPICSCPSGFTGDPFVRCIFRERKPFNISLSLPRQIVPFFFQSWIYSSAKIVSPTKSNLLTKLNISTNFNLPQKMQSFDHYFLKSDWLNISFK